MQSQLWQAIKIVRVCFGSIQDISQNALNSFHSIVATRLTLLQLLKL